MPASKRYRNVFGVSARPGKNNDYNSRPLNSCLWTAHWSWVIVVAVGVPALAIAVAVRAILLHMNGSQDQPSRGRAVGQRVLSQPAQHRQL